MADYTSKYTGLQIDDALTSAFNVKLVRGLIKMTDDGPVAAVPDEDFLYSGSTVSVTGLLKGVLNEDTNEIEVQQAEAGVDYQTPLRAGVDYATSVAVANKQSKITAKGLLKGLGDGSVAEAVPGTDYASPIVPCAITLDVAAWTGAEAPFQQTVTVSSVTANSNIIVAPAFDSRTAWSDAEIYCSAQADGSLTFVCSAIPTEAVTANVLIVG